MLPGPVRLRVLFARHRMGRAGCGVLRCCLASSTREAPGKTALPPLRAERANAPMRDPRAPLMCNARRFAKAGPEPINRRGGAPRGERPTSLDARRPLAPAGHHHWPADGCRCTRAPVGAPLPSRLVRENRKPRRTNASREGRRLHGDRPRMTAPSPRALAMRRNTVRQTTAHGLPCGCAARPYVRK